MKKLSAKVAGLLLAACLVVSGASSAARGSAGIVPGKLTCEYQIDPSVVDAQHPRLSWINTAAAGLRGQEQRAYQIEVASTEKALRDGTADLWNSGKVKSPQSTLVKYAGKPLQSRETCWWRVRVWDGKGNVSAWSEPARWNMGILDPSEWKCRWIGAPWQGEESLEALGKDVPPPAPLLRKSFGVDKEVASAYFYGTGLGYFELYINGEKVGDDVLAPNLTNYGKRPGLEKRGIPVEDNFREYRVMYVGYDVTDRVRRGENVLGAILGNGFYNAKIHWVMAFGSPRFFGELHITYADGTQDVVLSDGSWKASESAIVSDGVYSGEQYDARREQPGWCAPGFDDSAWQPVALRKAPEGKLVAQNGPADRVMERLEPVKIEKLGEGRYKVDFGQEISGWLHLKDVRGEPGQKIDIRYICESPVGSNSYTMKGGGPESYHTRFTWYVCREVELSGWPGELRPEQVTAEAVYSDVATTGCFECSNPLFNTINRIWWRSQTDNMHGSVASDCPHRERSAYTGDGQVACVTVMHNLDAAAFYNKWIRDMWGAQNPETGYVPNGAPWQPGCGGGVAWGAAMNIMPWEFYVHYGDRDLLAGNYDAMKEQIRFMQNWVGDDGVMLMQTPNQWMNLGDWCPAFDFPPAEMVHTFYLWRCADYTARAAEALGKTDDAKAYRELADRTAAAFHKRFYDPQKGTYGRYGGNIFALRIGVPDEYRDRVVASLRQDILDNGGHLDTGIFGTQFFFEVLAENGLGELAYEAMNKRDYPSFGHWIDQGATTTWEQWNGENSRNHPMFGGSLTWFYRKLAGLNADPSQPGYRHIVFRPQPVSQIDWAKYATATPYGQASVDWSKRGGRFTMTVEVPVGCTATVCVPDAKAPSAVRTDGTGKKDGNIVYNGMKDDYAEYTVRSGKYTFTVE